MQPLTRNCDRQSLAPDARPAYTREVVEPQEARRAEGLRSTDPAPRPRLEGRAAAPRELGRGPRPQVVDGFTAAKAAHGPTTFGVFRCSKATNEVNFAAQKFSRAVLGSNNIDSCNRT